MLWPVPPLPPVRRPAFALSLVVGLGLAASACRVVSHPTEPYAPPASATAPASWDEVLAAPIEVEVRTVVSAQWESNLRGLLNLRHPAAKEAGLKNEKVPIVLAVGIVRHPEAGDFLVDTGIDTGLAEGNPDGAARGLLKTVAKDMRPVESLAAIIERHELAVSGVLLTHSHFDHILGLPDLPPEVPIYTGPHELGDRRKLNGLQRPTSRHVFEGRAPVREIDPATTIALDPFPAVVDLLGDGSIWGIVSEGHTEGSMAYLINATDGPVLFVGDTSHTRWGFEHGVEPGAFTSDHALNMEALERLRTFVERYPQTKVYVGHEL